MTIRLSGDWVTYRGCGAESSTVNSSPDHHLPQRLQIDILRTLVEDALHCLLFSVLELICCVLRRDSCRVALVDGFTLRHTLHHFSICAIHALLFILVVFVVLFCCVVCSTSLSYDYEYRSCRRPCRCAAASIVQTAAGVEDDLYEL